MRAAGAWLPYCGPAPAPGSWLEQWNFDPLVLGGIGVAWLALWRVAPRASERRLIVLAAALTGFLYVSPFCALGSALFLARTAHHVLLVAVLAPLLACAMPRAGAGPPGGLAIWTGVQAVVFWSWHAPDAYALALSNDAVFWAMQLSLLGTAVGFWAAMRRSAAPGAVAALFFTTVQMGLLGALITFAGTPLFRPHLFTTAAWGLSPLEDQQLAGLTMWAPAAAIYLVAGLWIAQRWMAREVRSLAS